MAMEFIKGEAQRMAQENLENHERFTEEQKRRKGIEQRRREEIIARSIEEHNLRFQPLQGILNYFSDAIEGVRKEYFPDSPIFVTDNYEYREGEKQARRYHSSYSDDYEPKETDPYDSYYRAISFADSSNDKFFTIFAIAEMVEGKTSYKIVLMYEPPALREYHSEDRESVKKAMQGARQGDLVSVTPPGTLFKVYEGRPDAEHITTFRTKFIPRNKTPLRLQDYWIGYGDYKPIPFENSQETTDTVLRVMAKILSRKEYEKIKPPAQENISAA